MGIPSKAAFETFIEYSIWKIPEKIANEIGSINFTSPELVLSYLTLLDNLFKEHESSFKSNEVYSWFYSQENFKRSNKSLFRKIKFVPSRFKTINEFNEFRVTDILHSFDNEIWDRETDDEKQNLILRQMDNERRLEIFSYWYRPNRNNRLFTDIVKCFYNYFYTERASEIYIAKFTANKVLRHLESNLNEFMGLVKFEEFLAFKDKILFGTQTLRFIERIKRQSFEIPFDRNDKTLKERVLIFDLNKVFIKHFKAQKPNAIFYLLMLEGVKNNIEKRGIERMIARLNNGTKD